MANVYAVRAQYTIHGKITNAQKEPVPYAAVILLRAADSSIIKTEVSDTNGNYSLTASSVSGILIKVSATGFADQFSTITEIHPDIPLNFVLTTNDHELTTVSVSSQKPLFERKADRIIFNVAGSVTAIGGNALDAVKKAPGVIVKQEDNSINLVGKSGVIVLVNGRQLQLSGDDLITYLQSIASDNIDRIEVITTPPAQYDAAGNSGLINIVLKKNNKNGFNGDVRAGYEQSAYGTGIGGANLKYRAGKLNVYAGASYTDGAKGVIERLNTYYPGNAALLSDAYKKTITDLQYTVGADYGLHKNGVLGIQFMGSDVIRVDNENINLLSVRGNNTIPDSIVHTNAWYRGKRDNNTLNLNYVWNIDTSGKKLTVNANRLWYSNNKNRQYETQDYYGNFSSPTGTSSMDRNIGNQSIHINTAQADVELPYKFMNISFGAKASFTDNNSDNSFLYYANGSYYNDPAVSDNFSYTENIQALYVNLQKTLGKWSLQAGLRDEATQTHSISLNPNQVNTNEYNGLFPTAYVGYNADKDNTFNFNYSKRINRPGYSDLDPYRSYTSPYSYSVGNPFLQPSYNHNFELNYVLKGKYTFTAFYQLEQNAFGKLFFADSNTIYVKSANYGSNTTYGITAVAPCDVTPWWSMQVQASGFVQGTASGYYTGTIQRYQQLSYYGYIGNSFTLNKAKTVLAEVDGVYESKYLSDLFYRKPEGSLDAGFKSLFFDKKLIISINATDILATQKARGTNIMTGQTINHYFDTRNVRLMVNYKFGNNKIKEKRDRSTGIEDEKSRV